MAAFRTCLNCIEPEFLDLGTRIEALDQSSTNLRSKRTTVCLDTVRKDVEREGIALVLEALFHLQMDGEVLSGNRLDVAHLSVLWLLLISVFVFLKCDAVNLGRDFNAWEVIHDGHVGSLDLERCGGAQNEGDSDLR